MEHDIILKRLLIKLAMDNELRELQKGKFDDNQILLNYLAATVFSTFPPIMRYHKMYPDKMKKMNFLNYYSKFVSLSRNATRHDIGGFRHFASMFDQFLKTPSEIQLRKGELQGQQKYINEERATLADEYRGQQIIEMFAEIFRDAITKKEPVETIFGTIRHAKNISELPPMFQKLFQFLHEHFAPKLLVQSFDTVSKVNKWKIVYSLIPRKAIKAVLKMINTSSLAGGLINLFLAKPFGSKNILQRMFTEGTDIARTERQLREAKRHVTKKVADKVYNWVQASYMATPYSNPLCVPLVGEPELDPDEEWKNKGIESPIHFMRTILSDSRVTPKLDPYEIEQWLKDDHFKALQDLAALEMRVKDKNEFIDLFGDKDVIQIMKEILPLIYEPIFEIYQHGDLPHLVDSFFGLIKTLTAIAENYHSQMALLVQHRDKNLNSNGEFTLADYESIYSEVKRRTIEEYSKVLKQFEEELYQSVRKVVTSPKSKALEEMLNWGVGLLDIPLIEIDVAPLVDNLPDQQKEEVRKELEAVVQYKQRVAELRALAQSTNQRQKKPKRPDIKAIPKYLLKSFNVLLNQKLNES